MYIKLDYKIFFRSEAAPQSLRQTRTAYQEDPDNVASRKPHEGAPPALALSASGQQPPWGWEGLASGAPAKDADR